ncbi:hypothetical protein LZG00_06295 [Rhodobacteraceae bacterium LMO-12]|nr:hypothetical protein [Rhodobacteraceae bacterium LMO-JJ12]
MQALVLNEDRDAQVGMTIALLKRGFQVVTAETVEHGMAYAELGVMDLVVMSERIAGRLSHSVALTAELRNPALTTMILTPRTDGDVDELYELLPSLYGLLGPDLAPEMIGRLAVAGVTGSMACAEAARRREDEAERDEARQDEAGQDETGQDEAALMGAALAGIMARAAGSLDRNEAAQEPGKREIVTA